MDNIEINAKAIELRQQLGEDENSPVDVFASASQIAGLTLVLYPMGEHISGICIKNGNADVIAINSQMSYGRQRFSLAHELYHLFYDEKEGMSISAKGFDTDNQTERTADRFASYFLVPYSALRNAVQKKGEKELTLKEVIALEQQFGMSHRAMLWRLVSDHYLKKADAEKMMGGVLSYTRLYGYDDKLCLPSDTNNQKKVYGNYILQAEALKNRDLISHGKYEELLIDAFRYDIVYGEDDSGRVIDD